MNRSALVLSFTLAFAVAGLGAGCSSGSGGGGTGGTPSGTGGTASGTGGATGGTTGTGGTSTGGNVGTGGVAGTTGTGGLGGHGGGAGAAGAAGGSSGGAGGAGGQGGRAGAGGSSNNGGSGGHAGSTGGGGAGGATASLSLTSTAFTEGMMIPTAQTCTGSSNMSPPLTWTAGPSGTMGYGVVLYDTNNMVTHWALWNLPASTTSLPGALPSTGTLTTPVMGQQNNTFGSTGYYGPCPMGSTHTYQFQVYAVDVATLPSVTATTAPAMVRTQLMMHALAQGTLSGTSNASK